MSRRANPLKTEIKRLKKDEDEVKVTMIFNFVNPKNNKKFSNEELLSAVDYDTTAYSEILGDLLHHTLGEQFEASEYEVMDSLVTGNGALWSHTLEEFILSLTAYNKIKDEKLKTFTFLGTTEMVLKDISIMIS